MIAPVSAFKLLRRSKGVVIVGGKSALNKIKRGVSFCHVSKIEAENQFRDARVEGNH